MGIGVFIDMNNTNDPSVDPAEVVFFQNLAARWWDKNGPFRPLHQLNELRSHWIVQQLELLNLAGGGDQALAGLKVLDVGCGGGILSESLARLGAEVTGIDVVEKNIHTARTHAKQSGLNIGYLVSSPETLSQQGLRFDVVFSMEVVEHVANLDSYLSACHNLVCPNGAIFIATINRNPIAWLVAIVGAEYLLRMLPKGTHNYAMLRKPKELLSCLHRDHFETQSLVGVSVNPLRKSMSLSRWTLVNYMLCARKNGACA
jgi:2-polyprenyl-6-hydroxyphenyl methylase/3-demethylubiquinone-9 3-methyltransferase